MSIVTAVTIGNFDGVHRGHCALVSAARRAAGPTGRVVVLSFDPHPLSLLRPEWSPARLTTFEQRAHYLRDAGADDVKRLSPTPDLLSREASDFIKELVEIYRPTFVVEGPDFRFGQGRSGSVETLRRLEGRFGYRTIVIDAVEVDLLDQSIVRASSSMVRWLLVRGRVGDAARLLGRPFELIGKVVKGDQRGRTIGVPTCNLDHGDLLLPADGVYAGRARCPEGRWHAAAISIGRKPTFGGHPRVCEAHILDYDGPLDEYGWTTTIEFHAWLRDQLTYCGVGPLVDQLCRDVELARAVMGGSTLVTAP